MGDFAYSLAPLNTSRLSSTVNHSGNIYPGDNASERPGTGIAEDHLNLTKSGFGAFTRGIDSSKPARTAPGLAKITAFYHAPPSSATAMSQPPGTADRPPGSAGGPALGSSSGMNPTMAGQHGLGLDTSVTTAPYVQYASYAQSHPPGSSAGIRPPGSAHGGPSIDANAGPATPATATNLWGYTVPSPPPPQTARNNAPARPSGAMMAAAAAAAANGYHGYNLANTRPMTAPGSSISAPGYYHGSAYGGMFSPATYMGAGFPQSFPRLPPAPSNAALQNDTPMNPPGSSSGIPPGSASSATAFAAAAAAARERLYQQSTSITGLPSDHSATRPPLPSASSSQAAGDIFAHQPPPLSGGAAPVLPFGMHHSQPHHPYYSSHGNAGYSHFPPPPSYNRPGTDYGARRTLENLDESSYSRPGTSDTVRPDTAYSTWSTHSGYGQYHSHMTHPSLYYTPGMHPPGSMDRGQQYNFVPLPAQPKKRPRRRFEEIERLYNCSYPGCNKAYGTLNHLNAHVSMQKHGPKRLPAEFKEIRKAWRQRKKDAEAAAKVGQGKTRAGKKDQNGDEGDEGLDEDEDEAGEGSEDENAASPSKAGEYDHQRSYPHPYHTGAPPVSATVSYGSMPEGLSSLGTSFPPTPAHHANFTGYREGEGRSMEMANSSTYGGWRPSTAPSHLMHQMPYGAMTTPTGHGFGIAPMSAGTSPHSGSFPPGYSGARKNSLTSFPPAFDSIIEEGAEDGQNGQPYNGDGVPEGSHSHHVPPVNPGAPHLPTPPILQQQHGASAASLAGMPQAYANGSGAHGAVLDSRPSTASSPFRFSASGFGEAARAVDSLNGPGSTGQQSASNGLTFEQGVSPSTNGAAGTEFATAAWSPDWQNLTHAVSPYSQGASQ